MTHNDFDPKTWRGRFNVSFEIVTPESAEHGEAESLGWIIQDCDLRTAIDQTGQTRTSQVDGVEAIEPSDSRHESARWITVHNGMEYLTGTNESRSLHFPESMTPASRARLCKLLIESR